MIVNQNKGILAGVTAGVFWGTPFVVPLILHAYSALDITFGRFVFFGLISLIYIKPSYKLFISLNIQQKIRVILLSTTGFWLYTLVLSKGVQLTNGVIGALIAGSLPVVVAIFGKPRISIKFITGLFSILIGLFFLVLPDLFTEMEFNIHGIVILFVALFMWSWFALKNTEFLTNNPQIKSKDYISLVGIVNFIMIVPIFFTSSSITTLIAHKDLVVYLVCSIILGFGASWVANIFWAYCSKNCPATIVGALIVSETLFGLLYSFIYETRLPQWNELIAIAGLFTGVLLVIFSQRNKAIH